MVVFFLCLSSAFLGFKVVALGSFLALGQLIDLE